LERKTYNIKKVDWNKDLEVQNQLNNLIFKDLDMRHKRKVMSMTNQDIVKDQIDVK